MELIMATKSLQEKFVNRLLTGRQISVAQIRTMGFSNPHDTVYKARNAGHLIATDLVQTRSGTVTKYQLVA
jgi:hypothetical protein